MPAIVSRAKETLGGLRERHPVVDHAVRMQQHYGKVSASQQAGAVTYFAFLSVFPILALAFFAVGWIAKVYPQAQSDLVEAINQLLPGLVGTKDGQVSVNDIQDSAAAIGLIGLAGVLYAGLGWLSAMRDALEVVFEEPASEQAGFVGGKIRDLLSLVTIGVVLLVSVAVAGLVAGLSTMVLGWVGLDAGSEWVVIVISRVIGFIANVVLFFALFKLLARPRTPNPSLWHGAVLGAIVFEVLKAASFLLLGSTKGSPAFQAFGIALILIVWINYFSRVVLYAASWAHTSRRARAIRDQEALEEAQRHELTQVQLHESPTFEPEADPAVKKKHAGAFAAGGATTLALLAVLKKKDKP